VTGVQTCALPISETAADRSTAATDWLLLWYLFNISRDPAERKDLGARLLDLAAEIPESPEKPAILGALIRS